MKILGSLLLAAALSAGCAVDIGTDAAPAISATASETLPPPSRLPAQETFTPIPSSTSTPVAFVPFSVTTWADNVLLRTNPGYLFPQLTVLQKGTSLVVLGQSPGGEWLLSQTTQNTVGWVFAKLVDVPAGDLGKPPIVWPQSVQTLVGRVIDVAGVPISGIQFAIYQGSGPDAPRNDAVTDDTGTFYAFMPPDTSGSWSVGYTAISCESNTMDASCNCISFCGSADPETMDVVFPQAPDDILIFKWR